MVRLYPNRVCRIADDGGFGINYSERLNKLRERIRAAEIDVLLVSEPHNIFYLSGCAGGMTGARVRLIVDSQKSTLIIDHRYYDEALKSANADEIAPWAKPSMEEIVAVARQNGAKRAGFEATHVTVRQFERLVEEFGEVQLVGLSNLVEPLREVKDEYEIANIAAAAALADRAFDHIIDFIKPGTSERDIAIELDYFMLRNGARKPSFETIVASGANSAIPHAVPSEKRIEPGDFVKLDFGAVIEGYHSDMTRTVVVGEASSRKREIYEKVREAQLAALAAVAPDKSGEEIDAAGRRIIAEAGLGEYFTHNVGHGVGLNVHESPVLGAGSKSLLKPQMVVTVEPGIYISGFGGVRIEDLVVVTETGNKILTHSTKELLEL
ncbi:MAG: aminopeptidase P family protein [Actinobacteria bacterium]|nr:aminopeptidase P family protein [Actinomycetota bacterium]